MISLSARFFGRTGLIVAAMLSAAPVWGADAPAIPPAVSMAAAPAANGARTLTVWTYGPESPEFAVVVATAKSFNDQQRNYKVNVLPLVHVHYHYNERLQSAAAMGTLPCVLAVDGPLVQAYAWRGYLQSLDKFVTKELRDDLLDTIVIQGTYQGHLYALGQFESGLGLWGNLRHLTRAGVRIPTVEAPWSLAEFEQALDRLTELEEVLYPLNLSVYSTGSEFYSWAYAPILQGFGGDLVSRSGVPAARGVLDGPKSVAAMKRFRHWFDRGWSKAEFDRTDDFENRLVSLSWAGHWKYASYHAALGRDLVLLPLPDFGRGIKTGMGSWMWAISSTCSDPAGAWAFVNHLMSVREVERVTNTNGAIPSRRSVMAHSPLYGETGPLRIFSQQLQSGAGVPRPPTPAYASITNAFAAAVSEIIGGRDVQAALSDAALRIDADIASNRGYPSE